MEDASIIIDNQFWFGKIFFHSVLIKLLVIIGCFQCFLSFFVRLMMLFIAVCCARSLAIMVCVSCTLLVPLTFLKLNFCHVKPTSMFRRIVDFQSFYDPSRFRWCKCFIKRSRFMGVQIVHYQYDFLCIWKQFHLTLFLCCIVHQVFVLGRVIDFCLFYSF